MTYQLMTIAQSAPLTGDTFPAKTLIIVGVIALVLAAGTAVASKKKKK